MNDLQSQGREKLRSQGVQDNHIEVQTSADMRYLDQIYEVNVTLPDLSLMKRPY